MSNPYADPDHAAMLRSVLAPPRGRAELLRVRRELAALRPVQEHGHALYENEQPPRESFCDLCAKETSLRARERELSHEDGLPRLIYADWIDERGDGARAEFIRVQVELAKGCTRCDGDGKAHGSDRPFEGPPGDCPECGALRRRERELLRIFWRFWVCPALLEIWNDHIAARTLHGRRDLPEHAFHFTRGFVENLVCEAADWLRHADAITAAAPLRKVMFTTHLVWHVMRRLAARHGLDWRPGDEPEFWIRVLAAEWPLIEFELPAAAPQQQVVLERGSDGRIVRGRIIPYPARAGG